MTQQIEINKTETEGFAARIKNRGQSNGTQTVELYKDGVLVTDEANLTLTPDETAYVLEAPSVFSDASHGQTLTMEVVTDNMTRTVEVYINSIPDSDITLFESGSLDGSFGSTTDWAVENTAPELTGEFTLHSKINDPETILSTDNSIRYIEQDQRSACYIYSETGGNIGSAWAGLSFAAQDVNNFYFVAHSPSSGTLWAGKYENGTMNENNVSVSSSFDTWYDFEFDWLSDGTIEARLFEVDSNGDRTGPSIGSVTYSDSTWASGGIGFNCFAGGGRPNYDNWRILEDLS